MPRINERDNRSLDEVEADTERENDRRAYRDGISPGGRFARSNPNRRQRDVDELDLVEILDS